jgi:hypothetical protein
MEGGDIEWSDEGKEKTIEAFYFPDSEPEGDETLKLLTQYLLGR